MKKSKLKPGYVCILAMMLIFISQAYSDGTTCYGNLIDSNENMVFYSNRNVTGNCDNICTAFNKAWSCDAFGSNPCGAIAAVLSSPTTTSTINLFHCNQLQGTKHKRFQSSGTRFTQNIIPSKGEIDPKVTCNLTMKDPLHKLSGFVQATIILPAETHNGKQYNSCKVWCTDAQNNIQTYFNNKLTSKFTLTCN